MQRDAAGADAGREEHRQHRLKVGNALAGSGHVQGLIQLVGQPPGCVVAAKRVHRPIGQPRPQRLDIRDVPQRGSADVFRAVRFGERAAGQVQVQRPGLDEHGQAARASPAGSAQRRPRRQMHDVDGRARCLADRHGPLDGGAFGRHRAAGCPVGQAAAPGCQQPLASETDQRTIFAVDQRQHAMLAGDPDRLDHPVRVRLEFIGHHEELQARVPGSCEARQFRKRLRRRTVKDGVQHVVHAGQRPGGRQIAFERLAQRVTVHREGHVPDRGNSAGDSGSRTAAEVVDPRRNARLGRLR